MNLENLPHKNSKKKKLSYKNIKNIKKNLKKWNI